MNINDQQRKVRNRFPRLRIRAKKAKGCWMGHVQGAGCAGPYRVCPCVPPQSRRPPKGTFASTIVLLPQGRTAASEGRHLGLCRH